ncbi:hypothetical protein ACOSP7_012273 [Xanthoceras sorbifolium]
MLQTNWIYFSNFCFTLSSIYIIGKKKSQHQTIKTTATVISNLDFYHTKKKKKTIGNKFLQQVGLRQDRRHPPPKMASQPDPDKQRRHEDALEGTLLLLLAI